jgi:hypothetical protein
MHVCLQFTAYPKLVSVDLVNYDVTVRTVRARTLAQLLQLSFLFQRL